MNDEQPSQPLTDAELSALRDYIERTNRVDNLKGDACRLLAEVDRLRAELDALNSRLDVTAVINETIGELADERNKLRARIDRLSAENSAHIGVNMACNAKIERLQSERDALVRKLGLDWGPDEFGDLSAVPDPSSGDVSDGYHTHNELYEYRMLYNAHAAIGWLDAGYRVVKSWRHSDGELCFGGGWFVVVAELPTGQVTNHYEADHWDLFVIPEETPPAYDGHSPADAAHRLRQALGWGGDPVDS